MTRKRWWFALCAAAVLLVGIALALSGNRFYVPEPAAALVSASRELDEYDFALLLDAEKNTLSVVCELQTQNRTANALSQIVLRMPANAYASEETSPAALSELYDKCYPNGFSPGGAELFGVWWNDLPAECEYLDDARTVLAVAVPEFAPGAQGVLRVRCVLTIPDCRARFGRSEGLYTLGGCLPYMARFAGGAWQTDAIPVIGDAPCGDCANYSVALSVPAGWEASASCALARGNDGVLSGRMLASREISLAVTRGYTAARGMQGNVAVVSCARAQTGAEHALACAKKALETYTKLYGAYPYPLLTVCEVDFPYGGMEYPGLVYISSEVYAQGYEDTLELTVAHETAHQWFYALVGSDAIAQPWQDEALCEYAMLRYVRARYGASAYETLKTSRVDAPMRENIASGATPGSPVTYFRDMAEYQSVVYGRGAALMLALDLITGGGMDGFLKAYCERFAFGFASREDFESLLAERFAMDLAPLIGDYLDTYMIT